MPRSLRLTSLASTLLTIAACGDSGSTTLGPATTTGATSLAPTTGDTPPTTSATDPTTTVASTSETTVSGGETEAVTSSTSTTDGTSTSTSELTTTGPVIATTTGASSTTAGESTGGTTQGCACSPGEVGGCEGELQLVCAIDCQAFEPQPCPGGQKCSGDACVAQFCTPGETVCEGETAVKQCNGAGEAFDPPVNCGLNEGCNDGACLGLCQLAELSPSTVGCSFIASRVDNIFGNETDSVVLGNTSKTKIAQVQLYFTPNGTNVEQPQGASVNILPGQAQIFPMTNPPFDQVSGLRKGGNYRVQSTIPIIAYQHSPITGQATNDASLLFPEHALKKDYVIASWPDSHNAYPSYFNVIALVDGTTVSWVPSQNTVAGTGVPAVTAGQTGTITMNRFDTMQARANFGGDLSGTFVSADKPIWVVGAAECINVPNKNVTACDHIQELMLPLDYWGKKYVGAHSPTRGNEKHYWRVFGGEDGTVVTTDPPQPGTPFTLNKAQWKELVVPTNTSFIFSSNNPFLPVQYLESQNGGAGTGDPAMYQMIPTEQFLDRYVFVTGQEYNVHYAQIIRLKGNPDVKIDGATVTGYYAIGDYEVSDFVISEGAHLAESDAAFGIISVGYTPVTSYAYPGGLKLAVINPQ